MAISHTVVALTKTVLVVLVRSPMRSLASLLSGTVPKSYHNNTWESISSRLISTQGVPQRVSASRRPLLVVSLFPSARSSAGDTASSASLSPIGYSGCVGCEVGVTAVEYPQASEDFVVEATPRQAVRVASGVVS